MAVTDIGREQSLEPIDLHSNFFIEGMRVHGVDHAGEWVEGARFRGLAKEERTFCSKATPCVKRRGGGK